MIPTWVEKYIGIPFLSCGRDRNGADCYGLVRLILFEQYHILWPSFDEYYSNALEKNQAAQAITINKPLLPARQVAIPEIGDIVLMNYLGFPCHMGMFVGENRIIHIEQGTNSIMDRLDSIKLKNRIEGYYRVC